MVTVRLSQRGSNEVTARTHFVRCKKGDLRALDPTEKRLWLE